MANPPDKMQMIRPSSLKLFTGFSLAGSFLTGRFFAEFFALVVAMALTTTSASAAVDELLKPKASFPSTVHDFGTVAQGSLVEHDFVIENKGKADLQVRKIHSACGCTAAIVSSDIVESNSKTQIRMQFNTEGFQGYKVKTIRVYTNDPFFPTAVLTLRGTVKPEIEIEPYSLNLGNIDRGDVAPREVKIFTRDRDFKVESITPRSKDITVVEEDSSQGDLVGKRLLVSLAGNLPVGPFRSRITIKTNNKNSPTLNIPVSARIRGDLLLSKQAASFGLLKGPINNPVSQDVTLTNNSGAAIKILSVSSDHPKVSTSVSEVDPGKIFLINISISDPNTQALRARVKIKTDHPDPDQQEIVLPVYAVISRK